MDKKKFVLLINADNLSPAHLHVIMSLTARFGELTGKKAYGDWVGSNKKAWKEVLARNSVIAVQECNPESAITMDALDALEENNIEGLILASYDSDFSRLAKRARSGGKTVIGMGDEATPVDFVNMCDEFVRFTVVSADVKSPANEMLTEQPESVKCRDEVVCAGKEADGSVKYDGSMPEGDLGVCAARDRRDECSNNNGAMQEAQSESFGADGFQTPIPTDKETDEEECVGKVVEEELKSFVEAVLEKEHAKKAALANVENVEKYILELLDGDVYNGKIMMEQLASLIQEAFPGFSHKLCGYLKFPQFIASLPALHVVTSKSEYSLGSPTMFVLKQSDWKAAVETGNAEAVLKLQSKGMEYPEVSLEEIEAYLLELLEQEENGGKLLLGVANYLLMKKYPGFNQRQFGRAKFNKFIELLPGLMLWKEEVEEGKIARTFIIKK